MVTECCNISGLKGGLLTLITVPNFFTVGIIAKALGDLQEWTIFVTSCSKGWRVAKGGNPQHASQPILNWQFHHPSAICKWLNKVDPKVKTTIPAK